MRDQLGLNEEIERMMAADRARGERRREQARARGDFFELKRRGKLRAFGETWNHRLKAEEIDQPDEEDPDRRR